MLDRVDWTATKGNFQLCIAALRDDANTVIKLMPSVATSGDISSEEFREWPVLEWVRNDPAVGDAFLSVYGEPLHPPVQTIDETKTLENLEADGSLEHTIAPSEKTRH
jgi:hypothetical protein